MKKALNISLCILLAAIIVLCIYLLVWDIVLIVDYIKNEHVIPLDYFFMNSLAPHAGIYNFASFEFYTQKLMLLQSSGWLRLPLYFVSIAAAVYFLAKRINVILGDKPSAYFKKVLEARRIKHQEKTNRKKQTKLEKLKQKIKQIEEES